MGLDLLVFQMSIEDAFQIRFSDEDLPSLSTPVRLKNYLFDHLPISSEDVCLSQRAFYRLRTAIMARTTLTRFSIRPETSLLSLIPRTDWDVVWNGVRQEVGAASVKTWPRLADPGWFDLFRAPRVTNLREAATILALRHPFVLKTNGEGWTLKQITCVVHTLMEEELGIIAGEQTDNLRWTEDMGID